MAVAALAMLGGFLTLVVALRSGGLAFDVPILSAVHDGAGPRLDRAFLWISHASYGRGVVPFDILLVLFLLLRRRWRGSLFAALALGGSIWLNGAVKDAIARPRPDAWMPLLHYAGYSFPSGHAMATMTLTWVLVVLLWRTRWRWPVLAGMAAFTLLVGLSRPYLGVHYPSDVLGGWLLGGAWAAACASWIMRRSRTDRQQQRA